MFATILVVFRLHQDTTNLLCDTGVANSITVWCSILQVPTTQVATMSTDLKFVELTAGVIDFFYMKYVDYTLVYTSYVLFFNKTI